MLPDRPSPLTEDNLKQLQHWFIEWHRRLDDPPSRGMLDPEELPINPMPETCPEKDTRWMRRIMSWLAEGDGF